MKKRCTFAANVLKRRVLKTENLKQMFILLVGRMFVYKLEYEGLVLYVGQTKDMTNRYYKHSNKKSNRSGSRYIPDDFQWSMVLLEECEDVMGTSREQHFYDTLKPLYNKKRPGQTHAEYLVNCPEQNRASKRKYHAANRDAINAKRREIRRAKKQLNAVPTTPPQTEVAS
jgi:predicted GIY-YIG superfamily endonuclease